MLGDFAPGSVVDFVFTTTSLGVPTTLVGGAVSIYKANGVAESTTGVTLTVDFDARTGLHHVRVDTSLDGVFYAAGGDYSAVLTAGTCGGDSVVGFRVGAFSLNNRSALRPAVAGRTLDVSAAGAVTLAAAAIQALWDGLTAAMTTVGSIGKLLVDRLDVAVSTRAASAATVTIAAPVSSSGHLTIKQGDDHSNTDGAAIDVTYTSSTYDPSSPTSLTLRIYSGSTAVASIAGTVVGAASPWTLRFQPTAAETAAITAGSGYRYDVEVVKNARKRTLAEGDCTVTVD